MSWAQGAAMVNVLNTTPRGPNSNWGGVLLVVCPVPVGRGAQVLAHMLRGFALVKD